MNGGRSEKAREREKGRIQPTGGPPTIKKRSTSNPTGERSACAVFSPVFLFTGALVFAELLTPALTCIGLREHAQVRVRVRVRVRERAGFATGRTERAGGRWAMMCCEAARARSMAATGHASQTAFHNNREESREGGEDGVSDEQQGAGTGFKACDREANLASRSPVWGATGVAGRWPGVG